MLALLLQGAQQAPPIYVTVQQPFGGTPEWEKTLISAGIGALFGIISSIAMEYVKPYLTKRAVAEQVRAEFNRNFDRLEEALGLSWEIGKLSGEARQGKWNDFRITTALIQDDRFQFYYTGQKSLIYKIDPNGDLSRFYALTKRALPSAADKDRYDEARRILHMAFVAADLYESGTDGKRKRTSHEMDEYMYAIQKEAQEKKAARDRDEK